MERWAGTVFVIGQRKEEPSGNAAYQVSLYCIEISLFTLLFFTHRGPFWSWFLDAKGIWCVKYKWQGAGSRGVGGVAPCPTQPCPAGSSPSGPTTGHSWDSSKLFTDSNYSLRNTSTQEKEYYKVSHFFHFWKLLKRGRRQYQNYRWHRKEQESRKEEIWKEEWINTKVERRELVTVVSGFAKQG